MVFYGLRSTKPKNFRPKNPSTRLHASPKDSAVLPSVSRATLPSHALARATRALQRYDVILHYPGLTRFIQTALFDPDRLANLTRSELPAKTKERKKKKKRREKILPPSGLLTLTKKSKFSKRACPTQFFKYILIFGPVSSFETQKLCKRPISKKVDFCANVDQMSKFLRWTYLAQFFAYIPILKSVLSFETQKLHK